MPCWPELPELPVHPQPFVKNEAAGRSLHFSWDAMQSLMSCQNPFDLELPYTKTMMAFLLAKPHPAHILMIGLGGGSLVKFCYQNLPKTRITVVEINPHVIAMRQQFLIPDDDGRLQVVCADGAHFVRDASPGFDVILVDGFDVGGISLQLCTADFYDNCHRVMTPASVLVLNLDNDNPAHPVFIERITQAFGGHVVEIDVIDRSNSIAFANKGISISSHGMSLSGSLGHHAPAARSQLQSEMQRVLEILDSRQPLGQAACAAL